MENDDTAVMEDAALDADAWGAIPTSEQAQMGSLYTALSYASLGWPVFPIYEIDASGRCACGKDCGRDKGKHPRTKHAHLDATTDPRQIRSWWMEWPDAQVGIDLERAGLVDVAPDSTKWLEEFRRRGLPDTWTFASGGGEGHLHFIYDRPKDAPTKRRCLSGEYDILSTGYSIFPALGATGPRRWLKEPNGTGPVAALGWVKDELLRARTQGDLPELDPDQPPVRLDAEDERRWRGELVARKPDGDIDRSKSLVLISFALAAEGMSERGIVEALRERDVALGWHKYSGRSGDREYRKLAVEAVEVQRWGAGLLERVRLGLPIVTSRATEERKAGATDFMLVDFPDSLTLPVAKKLIEGFIPERSLILNSAKRGSYKSAAANGAALSLVTGLDWLGRRVLKTGPVVYVLAEGHGDLSRRNSALIKHLGLHPEQARDLVYLLGAPNLSEKKINRPTVGINPPAGH